MWCTGQSMTLEDGGGERDSSEFSHREWLQLNMLGARLITLRETSRDRLVECLSSSKFSRSTRASIF